MSFITTWDVLERAMETGPLQDPAKWDMERVPQAVNQKLKEHGLRGTYDKNVIIPADDSLADEFWKAGLELAVDLGILCISSKRVIKFSEGEIKESLREAPSRAVIGEGKDQRVIASRAVEDRNPPICFGGPLGTSASEDLFIPIVQSCAQYRIIDGLNTAFPASCQGRKFRTKTPAEILGVQWRGLLTREAARRAGRPGMPANWGGISLFGGIGAILGILKVGLDITTVTAISEFKTDYDSLGKSIIFNDRGDPIQAFHHSVIGGYVGGPEGAAIARIAATILLYLIYRPDISACTTYDFRYTGNCGREAIWACGISSQGIARNSHLLSGDLIDTSAGPGTAMILHEAAVNSIKCAVDGACWVNGLRSAGGKYKNHTTGLESKFEAEVVKSSAGIKRSDANEIGLALIAKYEKNLENPPIGKDFLGVYDRTTLKPSKGWLDIYNGVWKELEDLGLQLRC